MKEEKIPLTPEELYDHDIMQMHIYLPKLKKLLTDFLDDSLWETDRENIYAELRLVASLIASIIYQTAEGDEKIYKELIKLFIYLLEHGSIKKINS
ncbi:MAG: hypothetical protein KGI50_05405 [Patescibacteria group bacterium]|nr:hypothetical protein [Patescibacteria group bacterium]MDE2438758.1 hypothetical protein [Patescibacteria group bacterium]